MSVDFFTKPILNSPYDYPARHWELDETGQPTQKVEESRRSVSFVTPVPKPKRVKKTGQDALVLDEGKGLSTEDQQYDPTGLINELRRRVDQWRAIPNAADWKVTPETQRLLEHWRHFEFTGIRPFFCQVEAVETIIWLTEVAPQSGKDGKTFLDHLDDVNAEANPDLARLALKLATGAGKTTVMAMIIAWQTINAVRRPTSSRFTKGFLVVTPGITIRDRLRVLKPNDPHSYFKDRQLVPQDMLPELNKADIVITNYHRFQLRETMDISKGGRALLQGRRGDAIRTLESEGQMLQRMMPSLMGMKGIMVLNDEAHHCYREKPTDDEGKLTGDDRKEADKNREAARVWLTGLEAVNRTIGVRRVVDLSATPFFLRGSGYVEGTLFPWTMSDFSLMDAIESGIVKLPRVPVADNKVVKREEMPEFRVLWDHIGKQLPKSVAKAGELDPLAIPTKLQTALEALYGHYEKQFDLWDEANINVPPCFIVVCQNVAISKLVYDYISGFERVQGDGTTLVEQGRLKLFRNYDEHKQKLASPRTLLIDSRQLESGEALDKNFRDAASDEIERFRKERIQRTGNQRAGENISDQELLREIMNTVGKPGQLGGSIRCVVSVSMLTEGWDAQTVTHVLGVRAFGTQLLCEQVIGRALRRQSYELNDEGLFNVEYADVLGIPFDFTAKPVPAPPQPPRESVQVRAIIPERDECEIVFPRVAGYRVQLPDERLIATFNDDSTLVLNPDLVGPTQTRNQGLIGEHADLTVEHLQDMRTSTLVYRLTDRLVTTKLRDPGGSPMLSQFNNAKSLVRQWLDNHLICEGGTYPAQLMYQELADMACERIYQGIVTKLYGENTIKASLDPYNPSGSTRTVNFTTSRKLRWETAADRSQLNWAICDSEWEVELCRVLESHLKVHSYTRNQNLGFEIPYRHGSVQRRYLPDFIVRVDDGHGEDDLLNLVIEVKGYRGEDAKDKKNTMDAFWIPGVNNLGGFGRWAFTEFTNVYTMDSDLDEKINESIDAAIDSAASTGASAQPTA